MDLWAFEGHRVRRAVMVLKDQRVSWVFQGYQALPALFWRSLLAADQEEKVLIQS